MPHSWDNHIHPSRAMHAPVLTHHQPATRKSLREAEKYLRDSTKLIHPELYADEESLHKDEADAWLREIAATEAKVNIKEKIQCFVFAFLRA